MKHKYNDVILEIKGRIGIIKVSRITGNFDGGD